MLKNYFTLAVRGIMRSKLHSALNILSLAIGIAVFTIAALYAKYELSYDRYNKNADRTYRVIIHWQMGTNEYTLPMSPKPLGDALREMPEVQSVARLSRPSNVNTGTVVVRSPKGSFTADNFFYADNGFFKVFSARLLQGNPATALNSPHSIVISESTARQLFSDPSGAIGKILSVSARDETQNYNITAVMADLPPNSHFHADYLASLVSDESSAPAAIRWMAPTCLTYFVVRPNVSVQSIESQFPGIIARHMGPRAASMISYGVQRLTDIHLHSHLLTEIEPNGNPYTMIIFLSVGFLVLLIGVINFVTLSTARYSERAREVGIRKVVGSDRKRLVGQFLGEAVVMSILSTILAVAFVELVLPEFNSLMNKSVSLTLPDMGMVLVGSMLVGICSGAYPAFFLSSFRPDEVLRKEFSLKANGLLIRKGLVGLQFVLAIGTIICGFVIWNQLKFVRSHDPGFEKDNVLVIPLLQQQLSSNYSLLKEEFAKVPGVVGVTGASAILGNLDNRFPLSTFNSPLFEIRLLYADSDFVRVMGIKTISGVVASNVGFADTTCDIIVNRAAAEKLRTMHAFDLPLGSVTKFGDKSWARVSGVVDNFNYRPLYYAVDPIVIVPASRSASFLYVRYESGQAQNVVAAASKIWKRVVPQYPMDVHFLNQELNSLYGSDNKLADFVYVSAFLAVLVSMLGLLGLANYSVERRVKEIGIRKVVDATGSDIVRLLTKDFAAPVLVANLFAWPASYYFINKWLQTFSYRTEVHVWPFVGASALAFALAMLTVGSLALKASEAIPVESLRYE